MREIAYHSYRSERTVTVRCTVEPASGAVSAEGYGTATTEAVARKKALSEAVERLMACTPFSLVARPPTTHTCRGTDSRHWSGGVRGAPEGCLLRAYEPLTADRPRQVPLFWSSPWVAGLELRSSTLTAQAARLSCTVGWAASPSPEAALRNALFELAELLNYSAFLYRCLTRPPGHVPEDGDAARSGQVDDGSSTPLTLPIGYVARTPTVLAVSRSAGRLMPATGIGSGSTQTEAADRALLELAQAETLWRENTTAESAERYFMRRFERWPLLRRCAALEFDLQADDLPHHNEPLPSPLQELESRGISVWADSGAVDISGPGMERTRIHYAHVVSDPQPLLGLVRAGIPVFDTGEVRKTLDWSRRTGPAVHSPSQRSTHGGCPAGA
ncbi:YcaO-like family protein [Streptomyces sp. NPDC006510]|uniref:YcaO-like family protein n=1 Tax=Streptomyces sp. NPDC006510 TaxID=3155600 RepID=UPI0033A949B1